MPLFTLFLQLMEAGAWGMTNTGSAVGQPLIPRGKIQHLQHRAPVLPVLRGTFSDAAAGGGHGAGPYEDREQRRPAAHAGARAAARCWAGIRALSCAPGGRAGAPCGRHARAVRPRLRAPQGGLFSTICETDTVQTSY